MAMASAANCTCTALLGKNWKAGNCQVTPVGTGARLAPNCTRVKVAPAYCAMVSSVRASSSRAITTAPIEGPLPLLCTMLVQQTALSVDATRSSPHSVRPSSVGEMAHRCRSGSARSWALACAPPLKGRAPKPATRPCLSISKMACRLELCMASGPILLRSNAGSGRCMWWYSSSQKAQSRFKLLMADIC